jgi:hypothetical protein
MNDPLEGLKITTGSTSGCDIQESDLLVDGMEMLGSAGWMGLIISGSTSGCHGQNKDLLDGFD